jgi:hypothetical protein
LTSNAHFGTNRLSINVNRNHTLHKVIVNTNRWVN